MSKCDQFVAQPRNNTLRASIKLGWNGLSQRGYLRDLHAIILSGNSTRLLYAKHSLPARAPNRTSTRATTARSRQLCSARLTVAKAGSVIRLLDQHIPFLKQQLEVHDGFHRSPLVPRCLKTLKYLFPCAVGTAQCRVSNELNRFSCAAQYDRRARADTQLWINWKVRHGEVTLGRGRSSTTGTLPFSVALQCRPLVFEHACLRARRERHRHRAARSSFDPLVGASGHR